jgi:hypothetical protein
MRFGRNLAAKRILKPRFLLYREPDERFPVHIMRFVKDGLSGPKRRLQTVEMPSVDHMAILKRWSGVEDAFTDWLSQLSGVIGKRIN